MGFIHSKYVFGWVGWVFLRCLVDQAYECICPGITYLIFETLLHLGRCDLQKEHPQMAGDRSAKTYGKATWQTRETPSEQLLFLIL